MPGICARGMGGPLPEQLGFREALWVIGGAQPTRHLGSSAEWQECSLSVSALPGRPARPLSDFTSPTERDLQAEQCYWGTWGLGVKLDHTVPTALSLCLLSWLPQALLQAPGSSVEGPLPEPGHLGYAVPDRGEPPRPMETPLQPPPPVQRVMDPGSERARQGG